MQWPGIKLMTILLQIKYPNHYPLDYQATKLTVTGNNDTNADKCKVMVSKQWNNRSDIKAVIRNRNSRLPTCTATFLRYHRHVMSSFHSFFTVCIKTQCTNVVNMETLSTVQWVSG